MTADGWMNEWMNEWMNKTVVKKKANEFTWPSLNFSRHITHFAAISSVWQVVLALSFVSLVSSGFIAHSIVVLWNFLVSILDKACSAILVNEDWNRNNIFWAISLCTFKTRASRVRELQIVQTRFGLALFTICQEKSWFSLMLVSHAYKVFTLHWRRATSGRTIKFTLSQPSGLVI